MRIDEVAQSARGEIVGQLQGLEVPDVDTVFRRIRRRRSRRWAALTAVVAVVVAVPILVSRSSGTTASTVRVASPFAEAPSGTATDGPWASVPKASAGFAANASISTVVSTDDAFIAAGSGLWRSTDGLRWTSITSVAPDHNIAALAVHGSEVLGVLSTPKAKLMLRSTDDGVTWAPFAPAADAPSLSVLRWSEAGMWVGAGGSPAGRFGIWTSSDGAQWNLALPTAATATIDIVDDGQHGLFAYTGTDAWSSPDGRDWKPVALSVPEPYVLEAVAPGASLAVGRIAGDAVTAPGALLHSDDGGRTWTEDPAFRVAYPLATGWAITRDRVNWILAGFSGNGLDAWVSPDGVSWTSLPASLKRAPGGTLQYIASVGDTTVVMGSAPELDRYFVLSHSLDAPTSGVSGACPESVPRRLVDGVIAGADALPYIDNAFTDRDQVERALVEDEPLLRSRYPAMTSAEVGPGFGAAWTGQNGGAYDVVNVDDFAIVVHLSSVAGCPSPEVLHGELYQAPVVFVVDGSATNPSEGNPTTDTRVSSQFVPPGPGDLPVQSVTQLEFPDGHTEAVDAWIVTGTNGAFPTICVRIRGNACTGFEPGLTEISAQCVSPAPPYKIVVLLVPADAETVVSTTEGTGTTYIPAHVAADGTQVGVTALLVDGDTNTLDIAAMSITGAVLDHRTIRLD